jgi:hypothetical protein
MTDQPIHTEQTPDPWGGVYTTEWHCEPPGKGVRYIVVRCTWSADFTVRKVYEIKIGDVW